MPQGAGAGKPRDPGGVGEAMTDHLTVPGDAGTRVHLRRSARARRLSLRVGRTDGRVTLSLPLRTPLAEFGQSRQDFTTPGFGDGVEGVHD